MLMFNALIKAQAWLFAAFAALASPPGGEAGDELADEAAGQSQESEPPIADEDDPALRATCFDHHDDDWNRRGFCLARCDDDWRYRVVSDRMWTRGNDNWCKKRARQFCKRRGDKLDDWCWGRSGGGGWDDDDHDWDDDDHDWDDDDHDDGHGGGGHR